MIELDTMLRNLQDSDLVAPIFRIVPLERLFELFDSQRLILPQVKVWDDVYENFFVKSRFKDQNIEYEIDDDFEEYYGQCWSLNEDSDALWRIYSYDKRSVRIKTSIDKVVKLFGDGRITVCDNGHLGLNSSSRYVGKVEYCSTDEMQHKIQELIDEASGPNHLPYIIKSLFLKRPEFYHENEVRLIYLADSGDEKIVEGKKLIAFDIDPFDFIEEIAFDPRIEESVFQVLKEGFLQRYSNFPESRIVKSKLYEFNQLIFDLSPISSRSTQF